jgi:O-antigen ligase
MNVSIRSGATRRARGVPRYSIGQRLRRLTHAFPAIFYLTSGVFGLSIVFGGGTHSGFLGDAVLQLMSLPLLWMAIVKLLESRELSRLRWILLFVAAVVLLPLAQLVPLPPSIWMLLPGRGVVENTYELLGGSRPAFSLTLSPTATWLSMLGLVPSVAIFLGILTLSYEERRLLSLVLIAMGVVSVFLGLLQLAGGANSVLRFYAITNTTEAVGFFANRNHFAALLCTAMLFAFCWLAEASIAVSQQRRWTTADSRSVIYFAGSVVSFIALLAGQLMARSRAGLILSVVALFAGFASGMGDRQMHINRRWPKFLFAAVATTVIFFSQFALLRILDRFGPDIVSDSRIAIVRNTISAARAYMPFGSGLGTFVPVYQLFEKPADVGVSYVNHAHNDFLELWLEAGIPGLLLLMFFTVWLVRQTIVVWRKGEASGARRIDCNLMKSAAVVLVLLLLHSLVDYPLRTAAMMAVVAVASGLLVPPTERAARRSVSEMRNRGTRRRSAEVGQSGHGETSA